MRQHRDIEGGHAQWKRALFDFALRPCKIKDWPSPTKIPLSIDKCMFYCGFCGVFSTRAAYFAFSPSSFTSRENVSMSERRFFSCSSGEACATKKPMFSKRDFTSGNARLRAISLLIC